MKGQKTKQNGITLIALVISIIVMLILAGVSINALMGDNGILKQAQYASFMSEMAAVEEAVQLWGADHYDDENHSIPANGVVPVNDLERSDRLSGEVGYYRTWSKTNLMPQPAEVILTDNDTFNGKYAEELVYYPGGVEDLYYLDNDGLNLNSSKKYVIDAVNSMVYSEQGISLNGVRCYSLAMAKAVMNGTYDAPTFASAEVSGSQSTGGVRAAGNNEPKYIEDEDGNLIENPNYNPNGFRIIADYNNENIYKLYNNGELYAKGKKGLLLNSSLDEINSISSTKWISNSVPSDIPGSTENKIEMVSGNDAIFIIDKNKDVWAWGKNNYNKFGLSDNEQIEYSRYSYTKLNINGEKAKRVIPLYWATFIITESNKLYASGYNSQGNLGIGTKSTQTSKFELVDFPEVDKIVDITDEGCNYPGENGWNLILTSTGNLYFAGMRTSQNTGFSLDGENLPTDYITKWTKIKFSEEVTGLPDFSNCRMYRFAQWGDPYLSFFDGANLYFCNNGTFSKQTIFEGYTNCKYFDAISTNMVFIGKKDEKFHLWSYSLRNNSYQYGYEMGKTGWIDMTEEIVFPFDIGKIEDLYLSPDFIYYFLNDGKVYASGNNSYIGVTDAGYVGLVELTELENVKANIKSYPRNTSANIFLLNDGSLFGINQINLVLRDSLLEKNWKLILSNVKDFKATTSGNELAYIDLDGNLMVRAINSRACEYAFNQKTINTFTNISTLNLGSKISSTDLSSGVKDYFFDRNYFYVLFNNGEFYTGGPTFDTNWPYTFYHGNEIYREIAEDEELIDTDLQDFYGLKKVFEDQKVNCFRMSNLSGFCQTSDGKVYGWGVNNGSNLWSGYKQELAVYETIGTILSAATAQSGVDMFAVGEEGVVSGGLNRSDGFSTGLGRSVSVGEKWTTLTEETFLKATYSASMAFFLLSESGNVYGTGNGNLLGVGDYSKTNHASIEKVYSKEDAFDITSGPGWSIIVTNDGRVFGTGANELGILGRWVGADRNSPNSRYKTAFEWVECPELEI